MPLWQRKEHKKCCLGKPPFVVDFGSTRISEIAIQNGRETSVAAFAMRDRMAAARTAIITPPFHAPDQAASALKNYLEWLEVGVRQIASDPFLALLALAR
jgi:hypothetical protein